jgi:hypothetical protein
VGVDAPLVATSARKHGIRDDDMIHAPSTIRSSSTTSMTA